MVANEHGMDHSTQIAPPTDDRIIAAAIRAADGWVIWVRKEDGMILDYWIADRGVPPAVGQVARFYGGARGMPIERIEIAGRRVR